MFEREATYRSTIDVQIDTHCCSLGQYVVSIKFDGQEHRRFSPIVTGGGGYEKWNNSTSKRSKVRSRWDWSNFKFSKT